MHGVLLYGIRYIFFFIYEDSFECMERKVVLSLLFNSIYNDFDS